jgi:hypothetical protein
MITTFFLQLLYSFVNFLVALLPNGNLPTQITTAFAYFVSVANTFSYVVPIGTLLAALAILIAVDGAIMLWHFFNWVIRKIPGMQ